MLSIHNHLRIVYNLKYKLYTKIVIIMKILYLKIAGTSALMIIHVYKYNTMAF